MSELDRGGVRLAVGTDAVRTALLELLEDTAQGADTGRRGREWVAGNCAMGPSGGVGEPPGVTGGRDPCGEPAGVGQQLRQMPGAALEVSIFAGVSPGDPRHVGIHQRRQAHLAKEPNGWQTGSISPASSILPINWCSW